MSYRDRDEMGRMFEDHAGRLETTEEWKIKFFKFLRYLSTRHLECWGFFAAGFLIATIF